VRVHRIIATAVAVVSVLAIPGSVAAQTLPVRSLTEDTKTVAKVAKVSSQQQQQLHNLSRSISHLQVLTWRCQDTLGTSRTRASVSPWALPISIQYRTWTKAKWSSQKASCDRTIVQHTIPSSFDWITAIKWVQSIYPGTYDWLYRISDREGCNTPESCPWVWYGGRPWAGYHIGNDFLGADTVGGPLQFRFSTFAPYWRAALADLQSRGFIVPDFKMPPAGGDPKYAAWLSPMGQALTGGYMRSQGRDACHWGC
jgi:hypothetical protein